VIIANNLASLISTYRTDEQSLERAWNIARRLRGLERPEFQDTYGWIALRRGEVEEALGHLEPAAAALTRDPLVQFHLGMAYARAERLDEADAQLQRAIDIAGPGRYPAAVRGSPRRDRADAIVAGPLEPSE
jgi:cellulose synthase operon protein C